MERTHARDMLNHFHVVEESDSHCSDQELIHYAHLLADRSAASTLRPAVLKKRKKPKPTNRNPRGPNTAPGDNIVVTPPTSPQQLLIIDFDVSVRVPDQESWIEGYRGTEGWAAPELGDGDDPNAKYHPIRTDLWSAGAMLRHFPGPQHIDHLLESLADELQNPNPQRRPLLSCIPQPPLNKTRLTLTRKRGVDV